MSYSVKDFVFLLFLMFGMPFAILYNMGKKDKSEKTKIDEQNYLSKDLLAFFIAISAAIIGGSEFVSGAMAKITENFKGLVIIAFVFIVISFIFLILARFLNEETTKANESESIEKYLVRKKATYNKCGTISYFLGMVINVLLLLLSM